MGEGQGEGEGERCSKITLRFNSTGELIQIITLTKLMIIRFELD